jgi:hypothetical protein
MPQIDNWASFEIYDEVSRFVSGCGTAAFKCCFQFQLTPVQLGMMYLRMRYIHRIQELFLAAAKQGGAG